MKLFLTILAIFSGITSLTWAAPDTELLSAYQKEFSLLLAQKEAVTQQENQLKANAQKQKGELEAKLKRLEQEFATRQAQNERLFETIQTLEKRKREEQGRVNALISLWKRADREAKETDHALQLRAEKLEIDSLPPENLSVVDVAEIGKRAVSALRLASQIDEIPATFFTRDQRYVDSPVIRFGRVGAAAHRDQKFSLLGPNGDGKLTEMEPSGDSVAAFLKDSSHTLVSLYLFQSLQEKAVVKKPGGALERIADFTPALFLAVLFAMVGWLFFQLARL
jgi:hypothetical protein